MQFNVKFLFLFFYIYFFYCKHTQLLTVHLIYLQNGTILTPLTNTKNKIQNKNTIFQSTTYTIYHALLTLHGYGYAYPINNTTCIFSFYIIVDYLNTGHEGRPSMGSGHFLSKELRVLFSRAIFFSIFIEVNRSCKYTCSLGMEFFNLQVYM